MRERMLLAFDQREQSEVNPPPSVDQREVNPPPSLPSASPA